MSLTPPGEAEDPGTPSADGGDEEPSGRSGFGRVVDRFVGACRAVGRAVRNGLVTLLDAPARPADVDPEHPGAHADGDSAAPAQYALVSTDSGGGDGDTDGDADADADDDPAPPVVSTSSETTLVTDELDGPDRDRPELEVQWHGDAVTFVSPEDPDAHITSDVWEDVER